jgi:hypothetical protein
VNAVRFVVLLLPVWLFVNLYLRTVDRWVLRKGEFPAPASA